MLPRRHSLPLPNFSDPASRHELVFYDWGDVNARRVIVCVHGLTRNALDFATIAPALAAEGARVLSLSMPGRGESQWLSNPLDYHYAAYVQDCIAILDNFHLRQVEWIGTSMGGIIGMMLAASTDRIRKLVLNDVGIRLNAPALERIYRYVSTLPRAFDSRAEAEAYLAETFKPFGITDPDHWSKFVDCSLIPGEPVRLAIDPAIAEPIKLATENFTKIEAVDLTTLWQKIKLPTLILRGADSDILDEQTTRAMCLDNPRASVEVIEGVGHAPALMTHDQITRVRRFLFDITAVPLVGGM